jgi:ketosteroid isomerase-like protein
MSRESRSTAGDELASSRAMFVTALEGGDVETACAVYTHDATLVPPAAARLKGRDAIERFWTAGLAAGMSRIEMEADEIRGACDLTYELGRYAIELEPADGNLVLERGTYVLVHEQQPDGSWLRAVEAFNPDPASGLQPRSHTRRREMSDL